MKEKQPRGAERMLELFQAGGHEAGWNYAKMLAKEKAAVTPQVNPGANWRSYRTIRLFVLFLSLFSCVLF